MKTTIICIIPVKNESWILQETIAGAFMWADHVIIGDNGSTDDSVKIARDAGCQVIDLGVAFDEWQRRARLIAAARQIPGRRLIFSMDADELLSANWFGSPEWLMMLEAAPGTQYVSDWVEFLPGLAQASIGRYPVTLAFVDDDSPYNDVSFIHSPRIPATSGPVVMLKEIKLLHCIAIDPQRMMSKHRWYKCVEFIQHGLRPWEICVCYQDTNLRTYDSPLVPVDPAWTKPYHWLDKYRSRDMRDLVYWWDEELLNYFDRYGVGKFRKLNIWNVDWTSLSEKLGRPSRYQDPRSAFEIIIHKLIERYREQLKLGRPLPFRAFNLLARTVLPVFGW
jgi:glycosyltransferase involved in cell wall biosynthesis